jgi:putative DNA primase/helicase
LTGTLGVAEGIETALAAWVLDGKIFPVWSCINAGQLEKFEPPEGTKNLAIFGDNDKTFTGQAAAYALAKRLSNRANPVRCSVLIPTVEGWDWNDKLIDPT